MSRIFLLFASASGFLSVALGAFGAHALKERFDNYSMGVYQTGVQYQFLHALALLMLALYARHDARAAVKVAGYAFVIGTVVFSGSLYLLAFTGVKAWGAVTPIGGLSFLIGWASLFAAAWTLNG